MLKACPKTQGKRLSCPCRALSALGMDTTSQEGALAASSSVGCPWQDLPKEAESLHTWRGWHCVLRAPGRRAEGEREGGAERGREAKGKQEKQRCSTELTQLQEILVRYFPMLDYLWDPKFVMGVGECPCSTAGGKG